MKKPEEANTPNVLSDDELAQGSGGEHKPIYIHGLETIAPYAVAGHENRPVPPPGSYSEAERQLINENTETVLK